MSLSPPFEPDRCYQFTYADGTVCRVRFGASPLDARGYVVGTDIDYGRTVYPLARGSCTEIQEISGRPSGLSADHTCAELNPLPDLDELAAA